MLVLGGIFMYWLRQRDKFLVQWLRQQYITNFELENTDIWLRRFKVAVTNAHSLPNMLVIQSCRKERCTYHMPTMLLCQTTKNVQSRKTQQLHATQFDFDVLFCLVFHSKITRSILCQSKQFQYGLGNKDKRSANVSYLKT